MVKLNEYLGMQGVYKDRRHETSAGGALADTGKADPRGRIDFLMSFYTTREGENGKISFVSKLGWSNTLLEV